MAAHPEAWTVPPRERRAIRRARSTRRLGLRPPLRRRVAGAAMRAVRLPRETVRTPRGSENGQGPRRRSWRQIGLRRK